jgi:hypothetical protein
MTNEPIDLGLGTKSRSAQRAWDGWYILYHDAVGHNVRRVRDVESAIHSAAGLLADGRVVDQVGPMNDEGREAVIGPSEIRQRCAALVTSSQDARL